MFELFEKHVDGEAVNETTPAAPVTIDLVLSFEPGYAVLSGAGARFRIARPDVETLIGKESAARKFTEADSPAHGGPFDKAAIEKAAAIARWLGPHGLDMSQVGRILGESADALRKWYGWALSQGGWNDGPARDERERLAEGDRVRSTKDFPGGVCEINGRLCSLQTGVPIPGQFARLNGSEVGRALAAARGDVKDAAKALKVDADDLAGWVERNSEMLAVIR